MGQSKNRAHYAVPKQIYAPCKNSRTGAFSQPSRIYNIASLDTGSAYLIRTFLQKQVLSVVFRLSLTVLKVAKVYKVEAFKKLKDDEI